MPFRILEREVLLGQFADSKERKYAAQVLMDMESRKYIERMVIYRKAITDVWQTLKYQSATDYQKKVGYTVERLTPLGYVRLCTLASSRHDKELDQFLVDPSLVAASSMTWGTQKARSDRNNRMRKKQAINNTLRALGFDTTPFCLDALDVIVTRSEAKQTISEIIASSILSRPPLPAGEKKCAGTLYGKSDISKRKTFALDNMIGVAVTQNKAFAIYHTDSYYGTTWAPIYKKEVPVEIMAFAARKGIIVNDITTAFLFTSKPKEFADLLLTCHNERTDAKRYFMGYQPKTPVETANIAAPFARVIIIPEQGEAKDYLKMIFRGSTDALEESLFSVVLAKSYPEAVYNTTSELKDYEKSEGIKSVYRLPEDEVHRAMFQTSSFPFSAVLSSDVNTPALPVLLGYVMDLARISRAFFFYRKTALIGTIHHEGEDKRALVIACFGWQVRWYKKLFPDAIYLTNK